MYRLQWCRGPLREEKAEGDGGGDKFDPAGFQKEVMDSVNKTINGALKKIKEELAKKTEPPQDGKDDTPEPPETGKPDAKLSKVERDLAKVQKELADERAARKATEAAARETARLAAIRTEVAKQELGEHAIDDAVRFFRDEIKLADDGSLVGPDDQPMSEFVKAAVSARPHWLPAKRVGGAEASGGSRQRGAAPVDLDDIKPGMTAAERQRIMDHLKTVDPRITK